MYKILKSFLIMPLSLLLYSCAELVEYPLEEKHVSLLAPSDNYSSPTNSIKFWWSTHEDAKYYRLQLVRPSFEQTDVLYMDTLVNTDHVLLEVEAGDYEWRVRPENNGSVGQYQIRKLIIQPTP